MQSLGNDFLVVHGMPPSLSAETVCRLADRRTGVGFDQLLVVSAAVDGAAELACRIFNADGGEVTQCGNGMRCAARFALDEGLVAAAARVRIKTAARVMEMTMLDDGLVCANMGQPDLEPEKIPFAGNGDLMSYPMDVGGREFKIGVLSFGNPHAVVEVTGLESFPVADLGAAMQAHECFPQGVNVEFMQRVDRGRISLRVYERGAGETAACGSGACAAAVIAQRRGLTGARVRVEMPGGGLDVSCEEGGVMLTGTAERVYQGVVEI